MYVCRGTTAQCEQFATRLAEANANLANIEKTYGKDSKQYKKAAASVNSYGVDETGLKKNNGVIIKFDLKKSGGETSANFDNKTGKLVENVTVHFNEKALDDNSSQALVAHEGSHVDDDKTIGRRNKFDYEFDSHTVQSLFAEAQYPNSAYVFDVTSPGKPATKKSPAVAPTTKSYDLWNPSWNGPDKETLRSNAIKAYLAVPKAQGGKYELRPPKARKN